jgi:hypothetical protein
LEYQAILLVTGSTGSEGVLTVFVLFIGLLVLWVILGIIGVLVKVTAWLFVVALVLFVVTIAGAAIHAMITK